MASGRPVGGISASSYGINGRVHRLIGCSNRILLMDPTVPGLYNDLWRPITDPEK